MEAAVIEFVDLKSDYDAIGAEIRDAVDAVMRSGAFILGPDVGRFERNFAAFIGTRYCVGVGNGLEALTLALRAAGIGSGDEAVLPVNTFIATALAVSAVGATPVFADCEADSYQMDCTMAEKRIGTKTKAIIPVHLTGTPADMAGVAELAERYHLTVIEDAAQAHGARVLSPYCGSVEKRRGLDGKRCGAIGAMGCFSFYPSKNLGCYGDGGAVCTDDEALYQKLLALRNYGQEVKYRHVVKGINSRLDTVQAAVLDVKLKYLERGNERRAEVARLYRRLLTNVGDLQFPEARYGDHVYHLFIVETEHRDALMAHLTAKDIQAGIHYPVPLHLQEAYRDLGYREGDFPVAERLARRMLSLPMHPYLSDGDVGQVADAVKGFFTGGKKG
jgi:dTDP-4-amino-4,6-dideoxygalactose transaminase